MASKNEPLWGQAWFLVEIFALLNLGFLTFDIYLAHSVNQFHRSAEYVPLYFSAIAPAVLLIALFVRRSSLAAWKDLGYLVAWAAIAVGFGGVILHLDSSFFYQRTLRSLTYSAPFAAPLAYAGLGCLLLLNRMEDCEKSPWAYWVLFLALGGFIGNFIFSVADHAQNGFFDHREWIAVVASALAVGFLLVPLLMPVTGRFLALCAGVMIFESAIGLWGFFLHALSNLHGPSVHAFDNFVNGAPPMAPLLFPNLAALGLIAIWRLRRAQTG